MMNIIQMPLPVIFHSLVHLILIALEMMEGEFPSRLFVSNLFNPFIFFPCQHTTTNERNIRGFARPSFLCSSNSRKTKVKDEKVIFITFTSISSLSLSFRFFYHPRLLLVLIGIFILPSIYTLFITLSLVFFSSLALSLTLQSKSIDRLQEIFRLKFTVTIHKGIRGI